MSITEIVAIIALVGYAVYKQTHVAEVQDRGRFKIAIIYAIVGLCVGGIVTPHSPTATVLLVASILLSVVVGVARGRLTRVWAEPDGRVMRQGTTLTVGLFLGMIAVKFGMGTYAYLAHVSSDGGFGEIMLMMAVMVAVQAQMIKNRADRLIVTTPRPVSATYSA
jgi:hypothetical protein